MQEEKNIQIGKIAIIDLDSVLFKAAWGKKILIGEDELGNPIFKRDGNRLVYEDKTEDEIAQSLDTIMSDILITTEATGYIAFVKGSKTGSHRYAAKSDYKANRPKESPSWWAFTKKYAIDKWNAIEVNNIEVDDAVNITRLKIPNSFITAIDKDLLNLEGTHYNWKTKEWYINDDVQAHVYFWRDMVCGQKGDGIDGLKGRGEAYFKKILDKSFGKNLAPIILKEYLNQYGEQVGIEEYYKNYTCLKILDSYEGFEIPEPIEYKVEIIDTGDNLDELLKGI